MFYGSYSPDGSLVAIATRPDSDKGGRIWLMDRATGRGCYLARTLSFGPVMSGQPRLGFFNGNSSIVFSSDRSWGAKASAPPQIYTITGFGLEWVSGARFNRNARDSVLIVARKRD